MNDFTEIINNRTSSESALSFEPLPKQQLYRPPEPHVQVPTIETGAIVQSNGDVLFRILAPTAQTVEVEVSLLQAKEFQVAHNFDKEALLARGHKNENTRIALEKQDNGCFEALLPYSKNIAGHRRVSVFIDGVRVIDPHMSVYGGQQYGNYVEIPDPDMPELLIEHVPHGAVTADVYWSGVMNNWVRQLVYTPPGYRQGSEKYPVIYLQEGRTEVETAWVFAGKVPEIMDNLIAEGKAVPCIIVMNNGMHRTTEDGTEKYDGFLRMLREDTIPFVEENYRCIDDKWHRAIAGLSMGGMQACKGGLESPDLYAWLGIFSASIRMRDVDRTFEGNKHLKILLDKERAEKEFKLIYRANGLGETMRDQIVLDDDDWIAKKGIDKLSCYRREIITDYAGEHEWNTWRRCIRNFASMVFK